MAGNGEDGWPHWRELDLHGYASITGLGPCPDIASGEGHVVTGRFVTRDISNLIRLTLADGTAIRVTSVHPFWSVDRSDWVAAGELRNGERLDVIGGLGTVDRVEKLGYCEAVYNLEVHGEHVFRVATPGVLVHNTCPDDLAPRVEIRHTDFGGFHTLTAGPGTKLRFTVDGEKMWVDMWEATNVSLKRQGVGGRTLFEEALRKFPDIKEIRGVAELDNLKALMATGDIHKTPFALSLRKLGFTKFDVLEFGGDRVLIATR